MPEAPTALAAHAAHADAAELRVCGVVLWFDTAKGFGFIAPDGQPARRLFVEYSGIDLPGYRTLSEHQPVTFTIERDERGLRASAVRPH
ncbi:hypothetical protein GPX89_14970 [Nocardia sp. ET3-3]|uniref:CSD domain-containing protein n=1 Tax=Nocardia terrae TaxID=2675851 RepID=A0A7K1UVZ2_9NOCA|nr:cold shock domain-containing protein [Nocardia terrae]MVU78544.1 hypothetical protein [Nocardia terrae]